MPGSEEAQLRIGFVGLGTMGGPMCRRLVAAGYSVTAFDLSEEALSVAVEAGAEAGKSARQCAKDADFMLTSLPAPHHVELVMAGPDGALAAMKPGAVWVDLTTNRRELVLELAAAAPEGVSVVDAPVTGAVDGARQGRLTVFAGGDPEPVAAARELLGHLGNVLECGPLGTGNVVKLVANQLWFVAAAALGEGLAVGVANNVDLRTLWEAICDSVGDSFVARHDAPSIFAGHYDPSFPLGLCLKDLGLIEELEAGVNAELPMTAAARSAFERAAQRYGVDAAELCVARRIADDEGFDAIAEVVAGGRRGVRTLDLRPGDLQIFMGRFSMHRVTRVGEKSRPRHTTILAYTPEPGVIGRVERTRQLFGRVLPAHEHAEQERVRADALLD